MMRIDVIVQMAHWSRKQNSCNASQTGGIGHNAFSPFTIINMLINSDYTRTSKKEVDELNLACVSSKTSVKSIKENQR